MPALKVEIFYGPVGSPKSVAEHVIPDEKNPRTQAVTTVGIREREIAMILTPAGVNIARTKTPESYAGKSRLVTFDQLRTFIETGELSATQFAVAVNGALRFLCPTRQLAEDKAADLADGTSGVTVLAVAQDFAEKYLR